MDETWRSSQIYKMQTVRVTTNVFEFKRLSISNSTQVRLRMFIILQFPVNRYHTLRDSYTVKVVKRVNSPAIRQTRTRREILSEAERPTVELQGVI